ncbi:alpha/beta-hydrolase [Xylariaceae sp. FL1272]|nr:alpha/beta-hydrolase [Xylariaceae sp. FL1272]
MPLEGPVVDAGKVDALVPNDPRVEHKYSTIGDITYHYMLANPEGKPVATIFLIHGWPDLGLGWRNQVPFLVSLGLQVVVPDMLGYGRTSAPDSYEEYAMKKMTAHIAHIIKEVTNEPIILGGHDWGSLLVWRLGQYYPQLIRGIFSICVPHLPMSPVKQTLEELVEKLPNFKYQLQLAGGEAEQIIAKDPEKRLRGFLNGMFGGRTPEGGVVFTVDRGVVEENIDSIGQSPMVSKDIIDFYVQEYSRHSPALHGPCNWYRTRWMNANDEAELAKEPFKFPMPAMLVMAENDNALPPWMAKGQEHHFAAGLRLELLKGSSHWAMAQKPVEVNRFIGEFVKSVLGDEVKAAL